LQNLHCHINKLAHSSRMKIDLCLSPALFQFHDVQKDTLVVVVDIFRASSTICAAFAAGAAAIIPIASIEEAEEMKRNGYLVGAERNVARCDFADFGNSPFEYSREKVEGQTLAFTSTNGTQAIEVAAKVDTLIIGAFSNINTVADYCIQKGQNVVVVCAGWNNRMNLEDSLFGGALAELLIESGEFSIGSDAMSMGLSLWKEGKTDLTSYLSKSEHIQRLLTHNLEKDIHFCLIMNTVQLLPIYDKTSKRLVTK
jgi:2-phosphosulfolactate phosphatase